MTDLDAYRVEPDPTAPPEPVLRDNSPIVLTDKQRAGVFGLGCLSLTLFVVFFLLIAGITEGAAALTEISIRGPYEEPITILLIASAVAAAVPSAYLLCRRADRRSEQRLMLQRTERCDLSAQEREQKYRSEVGRKEREAQALTQRARALLKASIETNGALPDSLGRAARALKEAEKEYADSAFDPYWSAVEEAAGSLAAFDRGVRRLSQNAQDYYELLNGRLHNFPVFPVRMEALPDPAPVVEEFRRVVRMGQTDFHFANIWEHRKTRQVLFEGFRNLGDAVNNLGGAIMVSFSSLETSISSGLALASEEQARTREALAEQAGLTRTTIDARADEQRRLAEKQVRLLKDLRDK